MDRCKSTMKVTIPLENGNTAEASISIEFDAFSYSASQGKIIDELTSAARRELTRVIAERTSTPEIDDLKRKVAELERRDKGRLESIKSYQQMLQEARKDAHRIYTSRRDEIQQLKNRVESQRQALLERDIIDPMRQVTYRGIQYWLRKVKHGDREIELTLIEAR